MKLHIAVLVAAVANKAFAIPRQAVITPVRETMLEAGMRLVHDVNTGTMASVFPPDTENAGQPFALMEYHAPCFPSPSLTMLLMPISLSTRNILSTPSHHATYTIQMPMERSSSPMSRRRVAFIGNITILPFTDIPKPELAHLEECYTSYHPDASMWLPYQQRHPFDSMWARFEPQDIYYVGGFGDTHYIGHIPVDMYAATEDGVAEGRAGRETLKLQS
ncbi:MAG: hypothetical protein TREMPRED_002508 [Tremellales sp. Tagirdzhanova-0007]|nr:MAG: hypothetical protein TREMPRED_002508 [Tremellales sp. Tagirdzhanova-0007]